MSSAGSIEEKIASEYGDLSAKLQDAADYVAANPVDVATRSLRSISASSGLAPATFSRLARALGFSAYEDMRELSRHAVGRQFVSFSEKARRLQADANSGQQPPFLERQARACMANIETLTSLIDTDHLDTAIERLHKADNVYLYSAFGSTGLIEYFAYMANYFAANWHIAGRMGASVSTTMTHLTKNDAILIITKPPFARRSIMAAEMAHEQGAYVVVISDTHTCPAVKYASTSFIIPTNSPQFFSSYAATLVLVETMVGMLVARAGPAAKAQIEEVEIRNRRLEEFWDG